MSRLKSLLRAKVPLNVLNFPFQSGVIAGHIKELSLHLGTFFESGSSLKLAYKPNDASNPFTLIVKTGTGKYGSPIDRSMVMSAEFNLVGHGGNPSFFPHFKTRIEDFGIRKKQTSVFVDKEEDNSIDVIEKPKMGHGYTPENFDFLRMNKIKALPSASSVGDRLLTSVEMSAATSLHVLNLANVKFHWGLKFLNEMKNMLNKNDVLILNRSPAAAFQNIPFLVMNKISVEHSRGGKAKEISRRDIVAPQSAGKDEIYVMCNGARHQLEALCDENEMLRKAMDDLRFACILVL